MQINNTACCAFAEIDDLSSHASAESAMSVFCDLQLNGKMRFGSSPAMPNTLYSFYVFSAAIGAAAYATYGNKKPYGHDFAAYIKDNGLGDVWESPALANKAFHPGRFNQIWIWMPDVAAVEKWHVAHKAKADKTKIGPKVAVNKYPADQVIVVTVTQV